ncbi:MATE family efflux transporter [Leptolyngbya cf. ectocarpi LEGE 11479]|uniref:Probable multidrug resistance protein NorM n=1 Tax=Leptolyngbya cf. ectocarpi LEGE 11479 TaxID=1828722 RepID=A0A928X1K1_LEPEC|nr:MATE family efflux transporter [Leptolyngbya ectocarpi]MBE9067222.1 MATE family efflux transporter [Leptolyngbya cf. ectocarpi LEGE 11479]
MTVSHLKHSLRTEVREFVKLAIPLISAQVAQSATGFADTIMMGRMGADVLAAGGLAAIIYMVIMTATSGVVMGVSPLVAAAFGAGQKSQIEQVARQGLWLAVLIAIPAMVMTGNLDEWMLRAGQSPSVVALTDTYLKIILWSFLPMTGFTALRSTVSALSQAKPIMVIIMVGTVFNIVGNYLLGFGKWGLPPMGLAGLALATMLTWWGMFTALALYVLLHPTLQDYRIFQTLHRPRLRTLKQLIWVGVPIGIFSALESGFFLTIMLWMGRLGTATLAAHQVILQTIVVVFMIPLGISFATTVRVGQWFGRRDWVGMQQATWVSMGLTTVSMMGVSLAFLLFPKQIVGIYLDVNSPENAEIVALAIPLLTIAAITMVLDGLQKAVYGALQGLQDTQVPMVLNVLGFWGVGLSVSYALGFQLDMGSRGLWIGQSVAIATVAILFSGRLYQLLGRGKQHVVP